MNQRMTFHVRTGLGNPKSDGDGFTDDVELATRSVRQHTGWLSVTYKEKRYQLFGGVHVPHFICLDHPLKPRNKRGNPVFELATMVGSAYLRKD